MNKHFLTILKRLHKDSYTRFLLENKYLEKKNPTRKERQEAIKRFLDKTR